MTVPSDTSTVERVLSDEMVAEIRRLCERYPSKQAVVLPALHLVHAQLRHVPLAAVVEIASLLDLAPAEVQDTLTFYGFFKQDRPHGKTRVWVCRSISCALRGADALLAKLCEAEGIQPGETTADGELTIEAAECLGACEHAPCALANEQLVSGLDSESPAVWLRRFRELGKPVRE